MRDVVIDGERFVSKELLLHALVAFYRVSRTECARLCDEELDMRGGLLGQVRVLAALAAAPEESDA